MTNKPDFNSTAWRKKWAQMTESERQQYFEDQRQTLIAERSRRAANIQNQLEP